jgi:hypothetical protein
MSHQPKLQWSPDGSSFIDLSLYPGKQIRWNPGGEQDWGEWGPAGTTKPGWEMMTESSIGEDGLPMGGGWKPVSGAALWGGPQQIGDAFHGGYTQPGEYRSQYEALKAAGQWDLTDPGSKAAKYIDSIASRSPYGLAEAFSQLGISPGRDLSELGDMPAGWVDALIEGGMSREAAKQVAHDAWNNAKAIQQKKK